MVFCTMQIFCVEQNFCVHGVLPILMDGVQNKVLFEIHRLDISVILKDMNVSFVFL